MLATICVTLADGTVMHGVVTLQPKLESSGGKRKPMTAARAAVPVDEALTGDIDFHLPIRPFMKRYAKGSGDRKLTLLIARLANGKIDIPVQRADVERNWSKMTALMGGRYNGAYDTRARDRGWIHTPKAGTFQLLPTWGEAIG